MSNTYFTVTGLHHYYGDSFLEKEIIVYLKKEKDNEYDKEAISVNLPGLGKIGYVANSPYTVLGESYSAGAGTGDSWWCHGQGNREPLRNHPQGCEAEVWHRYSYP